MHKKLMSSRILHSSNIIRSIQASCGLRRAALANTPAKAACENREWTILGGFQTPAVGPRICGAEVPQLVGQLPRLAAPSLLQVMGNEWDLIRIQRCTIEFS